MIAVRNLTKRYGDVVAVDDISFQIAKARSSGFSAPTARANRRRCASSPASSAPTAASSRSTAGRSKPTPSAPRAKIGYLPENNPLYEDMTVVEYLNFVGEMRGLEPAARDAAIRRNVGLYGLREVAAKDIGELSKGYRSASGWRRRRCPTRRS